ncbi:hypothetical protein OH77DRAFT_1074925 [Trametes cingulata]|nr:hypothetical protein OH77DRAFT_1074925 [Trametes cingulata]
MYRGVLRYGVCAVVSRSASSLASCKWSGGECLQLLLHSCVIAVLRRRVRRGSTQCSEHNRLASRRQGSPLQACHPVLPRCPPPVRPTYMYLTLNPCLVDRNALVAVHKSLAPPLKLQASAACPSSACAASLSRTRHTTRRGTRARHRVPPGACSKHRYTAYSPASQAGYSAARRRVADVGSLHSDSSWRGLLQIQDTESHRPAPHAGVLFAVFASTGLRVSTPVFISARAPPNGVPNPSA